MARKDDGYAKDLNDSATTGKPRRLDLTDKDRDRLLDPIPVEPNNLNVSDKHD
jgi:hypothetical protein